MSYHLLHAFCRLLAALPFCALYAISDFAYLLVYKLVGYRRRVVRANLASAFPRKERNRKKSHRAEVLSLAVRLLLGGRQAARNES